MSSRVHVTILASGDSTLEELANATRVQVPYLRIGREKVPVELVKVTEEMKSFKAYDKLRIERTNERDVGARLKRAAEGRRKRKNRLVEQLFRGRSIKA